MQLNSTVYVLEPTDLKFNEVYVLWYSNVARLIVTGIVPLASLAYLNSLIYSVVSLTMLKKDLLDFNRKISDSSKETND